MSALAVEQYEKAEAEFQNAVEIDPLFDAAFYGLGQVYMATKRYGRAVRAYLTSRMPSKHRLPPTNTMRRGRPPAPRPAPGFKGLWPPAPKDVADARAESRPPRSRGTGRNSGSSRLV